MSVVDSLSKGFETVSRHWWLILIPVLLDTLLWVGPHTSVGDLVQRTVEQLEAEVSALPSEESKELIGAVRTIVDEVVPRYNVASALRVGWLGVPSLVIWGGARLGSPSPYEVLWISFLGITNMSDLLVSVSDADFIGVPVWQIGGEVTWLLVTLALTAIGILIGSAYLLAIWRSLSSAEGDPAFWPRVLRLGGRFALFWVLRAVFLIVAGVPVMVVIWVLNAFSPGLALFFSTVVMGLATWVSFYGIFFTPALVMNDVPIWRAIWNSFGVVLRNFWSTLWLFLLINLIGGGFTLLWQKLSTGSWWTWIAIVGNAYIGTCLVAASLVFFQDRYSRWQEMISELMSRSAKRAT